jgi:hypothetical protein
MNLIMISIISLSMALAAPSKVKRSKAIDFDDETIEGVNKMPLDSVSQLNEKNMRKKRHLYRVRKGYRLENENTLRELKNL